MPLARTEHVHTPVAGNDSLCLQRQWNISADLADKLIRAEDLAAQSFSSEGLCWPGVWIISGHRTREEQAEINPDFPNSLHRRDPSVAVDILLGNLPGPENDPLLAHFAIFWKALFGRWGFDAYGPAEQNHFDLGTSLDPVFRT